MALDNFSCEFGAILVDLGWPDAAPWMFIVTETILEITNGLSGQYHTRESHTKEAVFKGQV